MDKKFASAEESDDDAEEAEMSVLSTFEQNETLRGLSYESGVRKKLRLAPATTTYKNATIGTILNSPGPSGTGVSSIPVPEFRLPVQQWSNSVQKRGTLRWDRPSRNQLPHHGDHAAPAGLHGVAGGAQC